MKYKDLNPKDKTRFINKWTKEAYSPNKTDKQIRQEVNQKRKETSFFKGLFSIKERK